MSETTSSISEIVSSTASAAASASSSAGAAVANSSPPVYKVIGVTLAIGSGLFIGSSFVFKKKGLLSAQKKAGGIAGEGHPYLKSPMWWTGMILMIVGEILNFVAYAFTEALLVTPLGALSVVVCAILSSIFLDEKLTFFGKIGCLLCILGATIVALNGPQESTVNTIPAFQKLFLSPGFLVYGSLVIVASLILAFYVAPKYGKSNMLVYISICSLIGGLSVACTQGLGSSILTSIRGDNQFKHWFMYFLLGFVVITLLTEINYLNKALELFNTAMVTPTYYVMFTGATLVTSVILYQGFKASAVEIVTVVMGFLVICSGITLLQLSKVDPVEISEGLDRKSTILLTATRSHVHHNADAEKGLEIEDPGIDTLRGGFGAIGSIHRAISSRRSLRSHAGGAFDPADTVRRRAGSGVSQASGATGATYGMNNLVRHQLYDAPMPSDAADKISMHSSNLASPRPNFAAEDQFSDRQRSSSISFAAQDTLHRYSDKPGTGDATHELYPRGESHVHQSSFPPPSAIASSSSARSSPPVIPPFSADITGERGPGRSSPLYSHEGSNDYVDPYRDYMDDDASDPQLSPTSGRSKSRFPLPFQRGSSKDPGHRVPHPPGPPDMDRQESASLIRRGDSDNE
ncbi:DUF803-domain-containing protein [Meredithblackwellia eburnea MCA 4105]